MIFHCALMVHITDTRAQKVFSCASANITEMVLAHDQHRVGGAKQFILSSLHSCIVIRKSIENG